MSEREFTREDDMRVALALGHEAFKDALGHGHFYLKGDSYTPIHLPEYLTAPTWETDAEIKAWLEVNRMGTIMFADWFNAFDDILVGRAPKEIKVWYPVICRDLVYIFYQKPGDAARALLAVIESEEE